MNRREILQALDSVREMSDHEVTINAQFIRDIAGAAYMHIKGAEKIRIESQKLRARLRMEGRKTERRFPAWWLSTVQTNRRESLSATNEKPDAKRDLNQLLNLCGRLR